MPPSPAEMATDQPCATLLSSLDIPELIWTDLDYALASKVATNSGPYRRLWRVMLDEFSAVPRDLFRYGLIPEVKGYETLKLDDVTMLFLSHLTLRMTETLFEVACHPFWDKSLDMFRYILMFSVAVRIKTHDEPMMAPIGADASDRQHAQDLMVATKQQYQRPTVSWLRKQLRKSVLRVEAKTSEEKHLFLLRCSDVTRVKDALSKLADLRSGKLLYKEPSYSDLWMKQNENRLLWPTHQVSLRDL